MSMFDLMHVLVLRMSVPVQGIMYEEVLAIIFLGIGNVDCSSLTLLTGNIPCGN